MLKRIRRHSWSIQAQFLLYSLALMVPALVFSGLMIIRSASLERGSLDREITERLHAVAAGIDRDLATTTTTLKALSSSPSLSDGDLKAFYTQAMAAQEVGGDHFFLTSASGKQLLNTRVAWGEPLPEISGNDWREVVASRKPRVSDIYLGQVAKAQVFSVSVPVKKGSKVAYVLSASISPERILEILSRANLDKGWVAAVADRNGIIVARSHDNRNFVGRPLGKELWEGSKEHTGLWHTTDSEDVPVLRATAYSQQAGWLISTSVPEAIANRAITRSWIFVATLAVGFMLLSVLLAYLFGRRIADPVRQLVGGAGALGRGDLVRPVDSSIMEVRAVGDALVDASKRRQSMERSQRESEDRLRRALTSADTGTWDWDLKSGAFTWDERMRELWGLGVDDPVTLETYLSALHPRDRDATLAAIQKAQDEGESPVEYDVEHRVIGKSDGVERWVSSQGRAHFAAGAAVRMTGTARDITERKRGEEHIHLLMREITHRSKNLLAVIQAMARQSKVGSKTVADFEARFSGRLQALAAAHDLLVQQDWHGVSLADLVKSQLGHYLDQHASQIAIAGDHMIVTPEAAQNIGLAVHELSTNAAKYGALSVAEGKVKVVWACEQTDAGDALFRMHWIEAGGPEVVPPAHKGFGQVVLEQLAARALRGEARLLFEREGVCWVLDIPRRHIVSERSERPH
jgi:PAS domain S-box-containing protein